VLALRTVTYCTENEETPIPESTPVMPGQTRALPLSVKADSIPAGMTAPVFPVRISGTLDWERGAFKIDAELQ